MPDASAGRTATNAKTTPKTIKVTESINQSALRDWLKKTGRLEAVAAVIVRGKASVCMAAPNRRSTAAKNKSHRGRVFIVI
jgi:hypothetical protein